MSRAQLEFRRRIDRIKAGRQIRADDLAGALPSSWQVENLTPRRRARQRRIGGAALASLLLAPLVIGLFAFGMF